MGETEVLPNGNKETPQNPLIFPEIVYVEIYYFLRYLCHSYSTNTLWCCSFDRFEEKDKICKGISFFRKQTEKWPRYS